MTIADLASKIKSNSSRWIHESFDNNFAWQEGYAAFTMGKSADAEVIRYILVQREHHKQRTFQEELIVFLDKYCVAYDRKYVFA